MVTTIFSLFIIVTIMVTNIKTVFFASKSNLGNRLLDIYKCPKVIFAKNFWEFIFIFIFIIYIYNYTIYIIIYLFTYLLSSPWRFS